MFVRPGFLRNPSAAPAPTPAPTPAPSPTPAHSSYGTGSIHELFNWVVADNAAKTAVVPVAGDQYKALWQVDTATVYILTSLSPVTWTAVGGGSSSSPAVKFAAYNLSSATQNIPNNTGITKTNLGFEAYDTNNNFDPATSTFTCTVPGYYQFNGGTALFAASLSVAGVWANLLLNGAIFAPNGKNHHGSYWYQPAGNMMQAAGNSFSHLVKLVAGDTIALNSRFLGSGTMAVDSAYLEGYLVP